MSRYRRANTTGATYFFTVVTYRRQKILCAPEVRSALRQSIEKVSQKRPFEIDAWVLLPNGRVIVEKTRMGLLSEFRVGTKTCPPYMA